MPLPPSTEDIKKWKEGDPFSGVTNEYKKYTGGALKLTPRKEARLLHSLYYYDSEESSSGGESEQHGHKRKHGDKFSDVVPLERASSEDIGRGESDVQSRGGGGDAQRG